MPRRDPGSRKPPGPGRGQCAVSYVNRYVALVEEAASIEFLRGRFGPAAHISAMRPGEASGFGGWRADGRTTHGTWRAKLLGIATEPGTRDAPSSREMVEASPAAVGPFDEGLARFRELVDQCPEERHLIHDDLINFNVL